MPVPSMQPDQPAPAESFAGGTARSFTERQLELAPGRGPFTWLISPAKLTCRNGRIVPLPAKAWHQPGFATNEPGDLGLGMQVDLQRNHGFTPIPHDRPAEAWGEKITESKPSTYLKVWRGVSRGRKKKPVVVYTDAWRRPEQLGTEIIWHQDDAGRDAFLSGCLELVAPDGLREIHIRQATQPIIRRCYRLMDREDRRGRRMLLGQIRHLPAEHVPADLQDVYAEATDGEDKPKKASKKKSKSKS